MRNNLPKKIRNNECGIVNLDAKEGPGTHWVAYVKRKNNVIYFDSYGNMTAPIELINYFDSVAKSNIKYNYDALQTYYSYNCGQLCIKFLYNYC